MEENHSWHCCILAIQLEKIGTSFGTYSWQLEGSTFAGRAGRASGSLGRQESETPWENAVVLSWTGCCERKVTVGKIPLKQKSHFTVCCLSSSCFLKWILKTWNGSKLINGPAKIFSPS